MKRSDLTFITNEKEQNLLKRFKVLIKDTELFDVLALGADAWLLIEGEVIESQELFARLISKKTITGEEEEAESGLKHLKIIKDMRDKTPDLFENIKRLPKKARATKKYQDKENQLLTCFRKGRLQKFFYKKYQSKRAGLYECGKAS